MIRIGKVQEMTMQEVVLLYVYLRLGPLATLHYTQEYIYAKPEVI